MKTKTIIYKLLEECNQDIIDNSGGGMYVGGTASEGYAGGYRDALSHVINILNGVYPDNSRYWRRSFEEEIDGK